MPWIDTNQAFLSWCQEAAQHPVIAVDTEFVWTKTFYPELGLIQLAYDRDHTALVDVLAVSDTTPLRDILENPDITKVFHEAASDLPILKRWCGALPANCVDTRIAAGFAGLTASLSLSKLIAEELGISLAKTETRTDWLQRPLTPAQLEYAAGDVNYMPDLFLKLKDKLAANHNLEWFLEEMKEYSVPEYYEELAPEDCWRKVGGMGRFSGQSLAIIKELALWRESFGRANNIARPRLIKDEQIIVAAETRPQHLNDIIHVLKMWPKSAAKYADDIISCVKRGMNTPDELCPQQKAISMDVKTLKNASERVIGLSRKRAFARQIDPTILCTRRDADSFVISAFEHPWPFSHKLLNGWRRQLLGDAIDALAISKFA